MKFFRRVRRIGRGGRHAHNVQPYRAEERSAVEWRGVDVERDVERGGQEIHDGR